MHKLNTILNDRETTSFYLSIGTGLMLESIFKPITTRIDDGRPIQTINIKSYKIHYINIETLIRNIFQSVRTSSFKAMLLSDKKSAIALSEVLIGELEIMKELYSDVECMLIVYIPSYKSVYSKVENTIKPLDMKPNKLAMFNLTKATVKAFEAARYDTVKILKTDYKLNSILGKVLITTHHAVDLLNVKYIRKLELLESHTGKVKPSSEFNSKYHTAGRLDMGVFPFQEILLYILGDRTMIKPDKFKVRSMLHEVAVKNKWTPFTSENKIRMNIKTYLKDYKDLQDIKTLF